MSVHYLDNAATARVLPEAAAAAMRAMEEDYGNPSSLYRLGLESAALLKRSREQVARAMGCIPSELIFTSGGTESDNMAIVGAAMRRRGRRHLITTEVEHPAVLNTIRRLEEYGCEATILPADREGRVSAEQVLEALRPDTALVSVMAVNNQTGVLMPIREIGEGIRRKDKDVLFHSDMVQGFFKQETPPAAFPVDMASVSGHKIGAPKGIGALYIRNGLTLPPLITGGGQEGNLRSGTEPMPAIAAFGEACRVKAQTLSGDLARCTELSCLLRERLRRELPEAVIFTPEKDVAPHILAFSIPGGRSEVMIRVLGDRGVFVSGGSACAKGKRSHVFVAMKLPSRVIDGALRVSFCPENTEEDVAALMDGLKVVRDMFG